MNYYDVWKKKMSRENNNTSQKRLDMSRSFLERNFKNHPSYRLAEIKRNNLITENVDIRVVNVDQTVKKKKIHLLNSTVVNEGDYICWGGKCYIVREIEDNSIDQIALAFRCNQTLNWKGLEKPIPCWVDNSSYGVKGISETNYMRIYDGKIECLVQYNDLTKNIKQDMRFIFDEFENSVYQVVDINRVVTGGVLRIIMDKSEVDSRDDVENNIAYNEQFEKEEVELSPDFDISSSVGAFKIRKYQTVEFTVVENGVEDIGTWNIDIDYMDTPMGNIVITLKDNNSIKIKNNGYLGTKFKVIFEKENIRIEKEIEVVN